MGKENVFQHKKKKKNLANSTFQFKIQCKDSF